MKNNKKWLSLQAGVYIFYLLLAYTNANGQNYLTNKYNFKNGIYLNINEFKSNSPSLPLSAIEGHDNDVLGSSLCMKKLQYVEDGGIKEIKTKDIWGICINGDPYIRHQNMSHTLSPIPNQCFYKIYTIGAISIYYVQNVQSHNSNFATMNPGYNQSVINYTKLKVVEYAVDLKTGQTFNQKKDYLQLAELIKKDDYFKDSKIRKKEIGLFISQYNQRHPVEFQK